MDRPNCRYVQEHADEAVQGHPASPVAEHLTACGACARLVERERRLVRMLTALPPPPPVDVSLPALPAEPGGRVVALPVPGWAAAAAAVTLAAVAWHWTSPPSGRVRIERVVDVAGAPPQVDERLLALTAGIEAVAMRRPTEIR